jgi:hypothetical protein
MTAQDKNIICGWQNFIVTEVTEENLYYMQEVNPMSNIK